jgi:hypothetical protein
MRPARLLARLDVEVDYAAVDGAILAACAAPVAACEL